MTDGRDREFEVRNEILDYVEGLRQLGRRDTYQLVKMAAFSAGEASRKEDSLCSRRASAVDAAARLILAIELLDAEIAAEGTAA